MAVNIVLEWISLPSYDFVTVCIGHSENIGSLSYTDLPTVDTYHYMLFVKSQTYPH